MNSPYAKIFLKFFFFVCVLATPTLIFSKDKNSKKSEKSSNVDKEKAEKEKQEKKDKKSQEKEAQKVKNEDMWKDTYRKYF